MHIRIFESLQLESLYVGDLLDSAQASLPCILHTVLTPSPPFPWILLQCEYWGLSPQPRYFSPDLRLVSSLSDKISSCVCPVLNATPHCPLHTCSFSSLRGWYHHPLSHPGKGSGPTPDPSLCHPLDIVGVTALVGPAPLPSTVPVAECTNPGCTGEWGGSKPVHSDFLSWDWILSEYIWETRND